MIGKFVAQYRIVEELGGGGMGVVYRAQDTRLGRDAALKFLPPEFTKDPEARERFQREAKAASALDHAGICTIYDIAETEDGQLFIAMAYYPGETLKARLTRGPLPPDEVIDIGAQIAAGLERAHEGGIVHRDIKPANIMLTEHGEAKIVDFGIAKLAGDVKLTRTGLSLGTPAYMAPEQIEGNIATPQTDLWALGALLYEMVSGRLPFVRATEQATLAAILAAEPDPLEAEVPAELGSLIGRLLAKAPESRPAGAGDVLRALRPLGTPDTPGTSAFSGRRSVQLAVVAALIALAAAVWLPARQRARVDAARALIPQIETLAGEGRFTEAYGLALEAERRIPDDLELASLFTVVADRITVRSEPSGAEVLLLPFGSRADGAAGSDVDADGALVDEDGTLVGTTPLESLRVPRVDHLVTLHLDGFVPERRILSSAFQRYDLPPADSVMTLELDLLETTAAPEAMVSVPGGSYELVSPDLPPGNVADVDDFFMDLHEVTNEQFREFVRGGGYSDSTLWHHPFLADGQELSWSEAMARFRDRTGLSGPRGWSGQEYSVGEDRHPVTGVSWYEAEAYAAFVEKRLPTAFEWEKTARDGLVARRGFLMPWGFVGGNVGPAGRANFDGAGTTPVDAHPFGIGRHGAYGMAGNAKEWLHNSYGAERLVTGGSWEDPVYVYLEFAGHDPFYAAPTLGFRCVLPVSAWPGEAGRESARPLLATGGPESGFGEIQILGLTPSYTPVDEATFRSFLAHYQYDRRPLETGVLDVAETPDWRREKIRITGPGLEDPLLGYLYLPKGPNPPYQTLYYVPSGAAFFGDSVMTQAETLHAAHVRSGRALFVPALEGMTEREVEAGAPPPLALPSESVAFRDQMVRHATELRVSLDYLETREELDPAKLVYVAASFGAGSRFPLAGVDDRFAAFVFIGGGIDERVHPTLPEASNINFAPYVEGPKLLVNGLRDEEHPWLTRGRPLWDLLSEPKELVLIEGGGHRPPAEERVPAIEDFLNRTLGAVERR